MDLALIHVRLRSIIRPVFLDGGLVVKILVALNGRERVANLFHESEYHVDFER